MARPIVIAVLLEIIRLAATEDSFVNFTQLFGYSPRQNLDFVQLVKYDQYPVETYNVTTEDGYILTYYRIPPKASCPPNATKIIFCAHGLYLSSMDFIMGGPGLAHAYIYSDSCYDVYLGNNRGNRFSRAHVSLNPDKDPEYWNFDFYDMAFFDLPAFINAILKLTGATKLNYLGHSEGITTLLILLAKKPEYNAKMNHVFGLSVASNFKHARLVVLPVQGAASVLFGNFGDANNFEIFPHGGITQKGVQYLCGTSTLEYPLCSILIFVVFGYNSFQIPESTLRVVVTNTPAGTSFDNFLTWGSWYNYGCSEKDYGLLKNQEIYGRPTPPPMDLSNVTAPLHFFLAYNDYVAPPPGVHSLKTINKLSDAVVECAIQDKTFGHLDHIYSQNLNVHITPYVLSVMETGTCNCTRYTST